MEDKFYKNPLQVIWKAKKVLMPFYLVILWLLLFFGSIIGAFWLGYFDLTKFKMGDYFSVSSTGLALTLALFAAGKNVFSDEDIKILAEYQDSKVEKGQALIHFLGPYVFTCVLFLITGLVSIFVPFIDIKLKAVYVILGKLFYINFLSLGLLSLFNLVITMLSDVYLSAYRK